MSGQGFVRFRAGKRSEEPLRGFLGYSTPFRYPAFSKDPQNDGLKNAFEETRKGFLEVRSIAGSAKRRDAGGDPGSFVPIPFSGKRERSEPNEAAR
jgi:hypothetical protein